MQYLRTRLTFSGIGKGVIGTSPPPSKYAAARETSSPKNLYTPRSAHQPQSTIHTPESLSQPSSPICSSIRTPASPPPHVTNPLFPPHSLPPVPPPRHANSDRNDALATPNTLFSILTHLLDNDKSDPLTESPLTAWSFLNDSSYLHPLLAQPNANSDMSIASSTGLLLKTAGLKVTAIKIDPYMNIDAGTMAPTEHGE